MARLPTMSVTAVYKMCLLGVMNIFSCQLAGSSEG
jgi:hypothetical protein